VEDRSTVKDRLLRNSCCQVCCVFVARAASGCRWNETSADDDQRQTEDDSHHRIGWEGERRDKVCLRTLLHGYNKMCQLLTVRGWGSLHAASHRPHRAWQRSHGRAQPV